MHKAAVTSAFSIKKNTDPFSTAAFFFPHHTQLLPLTKPQSRSYIMEELPACIQEDMFLSPNGQIYQFCAGWQPTTLPTESLAETRPTPMPRPSNPEYSDTDLARPCFVASGWYFSPAVPLLSSYCVLGREDAVAVAADGSHPLLAPDCRRPLPSCEYGGWVRRLISRNYRSYPQY